VYGSWKQIFEYVNDTVPYWDTPHFWGSAQTFYVHSFHTSSPKMRSVHVDYYCVDDNMKYCGGKTTLHHADHRSRRRHSDHQNISSLSSVVAAVSFDYSLGL
jgi:hypothetical protein